MGVQSDLEGWDQQGKFELVASRFRAVPMGEVIIMLTLPGVAYKIEELQREACGVTANVRNGGVCDFILLPENYGDMVTDWDISEINSGRIQYPVVRTIKKCGPDRVHFDGKNYTWDLVLLRL